MSILDSLPHVCTVQRRDRQLDELGGCRDVPVTVSQLACWRQAAGDSDIARFMKRGMSITDKVYFTADPELDEGWLLVMDGLTYEVISRAEGDATAGMGILWRVMVNRTTA